MIPENFPNPRHGIRATGDAGSLPAVNRQIAGGGAPEARSGEGGVPSPVGEGQQAPGGENTATGGQQCECDKLQVSGEQAASGPGGNSGTCGVSAAGKRVRVVVAARQQQY